MLLVGDLKSLPACSSGALQVRQLESLQVLVETQWALPSGTPISLPSALQ